MENDISVYITVEGIPAPQGSKKLVGPKRMVEVSKKLPAWREAVRIQSALTVGPDFDPLDGPLHVILDIYLACPAKSKFGRYPAGPPDLDKLMRSVGDALTRAGVIVDDARIVKWSAMKHWALDKPGATITIHHLEN